MRTATIALLGFLLAATAAAAEPGGVTVKVIAPRPADLGAQPSLGFTKITVTDLERSLRFYRDVMGMKEAVHITAPTFQEVSMTYPGENQAHIILLKPIPTPAKVEVGSAYGPLGIYTTGLRALVERARKAGAAIVHEPRDMPDNGVIVALINDPDGRPIELVQMIR